MAPPKKVLVLCDRAGEIQSVVMLNPSAPPGLRVELEGGGSTLEVEIDPAEITPDDLMGKKGQEPLRKAYDKLRQLVAKQHPGHPRGRS